MCETVAKAAEIVPIMLTNLASKTVKIMKEEDVVRDLRVRFIKRVGYFKQRKRGQNQVWEIKAGELITPEKFKAKIGRLLSANCDVVASSDKELGQTHTVKMQIDTGGQAVIKLRLYRTPMHKRPLVEGVAEDML